jgi:hypothetical protein
LYDLTELAVSWIGTKDCQFSFSIQDPNIRCPDFGHFMSEKQTKNLQKPCTRKAEKTKLESLSTATLLNDNGEVSTPQVFPWFWDQISPAEFSGTATPTKPHSNFELDKVALMKSLSSFVQTGDAGEEQDSSQFCSVSQRLLAFQNFISKEDVFLN